METSGDGDDLELKLHLFARGTANIRMAAEPMDNALRGVTEGAAYGEKHEIDKSCAERRRCK